MSTEGSSVEGSTEQSWTPGRGGVRYFQKGPTYYGWSLYDSTPEIWDHQQKRKYVAEAYHAPHVGLVRGYPMYQWVGGGGVVGGGSPIFRGGG